MCVLMLCLHNADNVYKTNALSETRELIFRINQMKVHANFASNNNKKQENLTYVPQVAALSFRSWCCDCVCVCVSNPHGWNTKYVYIYSILLCFFFNHTESYGQIDEGVRYNVPVFRKTKKNYFSHPRVSSIHSWFMHRVCAHYRKPRRSRTPCDNCVNIIISFFFFFTSVPSAEFFGW